MCGWESSDLVCRRDGELVVYFSCCSNTFTTAGVADNGHLLLLALFPGLHVQLLSLAVRKAGGRPERIYHVMRAAADVMFSLLTSGLVLPLTLLPLNPVRSFCSVCPANPIATGSIVASYST